jgi:hypothetical protein
MTVVAWDGASEYNTKSYRKISIDGLRYLSTTPITVAHLMAARGRDSSYQFFHERHGASVSDAKNLPRELGALVEMGFLTIEDRNDVKGKTRKMYVAVPDMKVNVVKS